MPKARTHALVCCCINVICITETQKRTAYNFEAFNLSFQKVWSTKSENMHAIGENHDIL